jgi:hypothetical protein
LELAILDKPAEPPELIEKALSRRGHDVLDAKHIAVMDRVRHQIPGVAVAKTWR